VTFNGSVFVGGAEMSVSHVATGHYSTPLDGSGQVDVVLSRDVGFTALFVSANC